MISNDTQSPSEDSISQSADVFVDCCEGEKIYLTYLIIIILNNTTETISKTAKSSLPMVMCII